MQKRQDNNGKSPIMQAPTNTTFIRVSSYVRRYFYIKYGTPVVLPMGHPMYQLMMRHLVYNPTLERISKQSSNRASMDPAIRSTIHELQVHAQADDSDELMEVAMPDTIIRTGVAKQTNWYYQLDNAGARLFRKEAKSEYWQEMQLFIRQCFIRSANRGEKVSREEAISDFMIAYGIPMSHYESMVRCERRERRRLEEEIEQRRDFMEQRINDIFIYT